MTIVVCVLDRGCDMTNPYLQPFAGTGFTTGGGGNGSPISGATHGTYCAGIVARSYLANGGAAPDLRIMPVAIKNVVGSMSATEIAEGITWATGNGAHIISMSTPFSPTNFGNADAGLINTAIQNAINSNVVMCVATGNGNRSVIDYPANRPGVIAVGACDTNGNRVVSASLPGGGTWGSNYGPEISVVAPGVNIDTSYLGGTLTSFSGTSAATPQVAGLAALLRSINPNLTNVQVREIIEHTADKVGSPPSDPYVNKVPGDSRTGWNQHMGYGRINVLAALTLAKTTVNPGGDTTPPAAPTGLIIR